MNILILPYTIFFYPLHKMKNKTIRSSPEIVPSPPPEETYETIIEK